MKKQDESSTLGLVLCGIVVAVIAGLAAQTKPTPAPAKPERIAPIEVEPRPVPANTKSIVLVTTDGCAPCEVIKRTFPIDGFDCYVVHSDDPRLSKLMDGKPSAYPYVLVYEKIGTANSLLFSGTTTAEQFPKLIEGFR